MTFGRIYVAGCGGMLGQAVFDHLSTRADVVASDLVPRTDWLEQVDVGSHDVFSKHVKASEPDLLVNLAAETDLEFCEANPDRAWRTNALGAENGALIAESLGVPYVFISTAGIFDGAQDFYNDYDAPNPLTIYAKSKLHGERFVQTFLKRHFVLRAGWMMGGGPDLDKKFVNKIYRQIAAGEDEIFAVTDKLGTPTYTVDFANGLLRVAESELYGTYNQVCGGSGSRFDVAREFVRQLGLSESVKVTPVESSFFAEEYFAERPQSEQLVNHKLNARGLNVMRDWPEALADYAAVFRADLAARSESAGKTSQ